MTNPAQSTKRPRALIIGLVIGLASLLAGCSSGVAAAGRAVSGAAQAVTGPSLGDQETVDPCGYVTASSFAAKAATDTQTHQAEVDIVPSTFTDCTVIVNVPYTGFVGIHIETNQGVNLTHDNGTDYTTTTKGRFDIVEPKAQAKQECRGTLVLPDREELILDVTPGDASADKAQFCDFADIAVNDAMTAINQGVKHLPSYPGNSAGGVKDCNLVDDALASRLFGDGSTTRDGFGNHVCFINPPGSGTDVAQVLTELVRDPKSPDPDRNITESTVAGRDTLIHSWTNTNSPIQYCAADTEVHTWKPWPGSISPIPSSSTDPEPGSNLIEYEEALVQIQGSASQACGDAKQLAASAWAKLPAAS